MVKRRSYCKLFAGVEEKRDGGAWKGGWETAGVLPVEGQGYEGWGRDGGMGKEGREGEWLEGEGRIGAGAGGWEWAGGRERAGLAVFFGASGEQEGAAAGSDGRRGR